ncbi:fatty-acid-CoA ligase FadD [Mycobacteroides abscessus subsp. abscessus]|uniref:FadD3 family acyl-CoA ligase n=1 Tax=Mycobacteroides abscessus TaxID=36809 RepID=UPI00092A3B2A|nr:FadD3 family acyl-CoA ligase [Mycobacteroides abscessus]SHU29251.1 Probable fatty-acid-CoA ligase FadD [Mycobacteroides abscessus subsp. abscessus]SHV08739.1 fatty-acid-CoA ligase FadD [Mycobacteroides abscessus subsp. abscessus]SHX13713.1 fatty-acid-CoA ligase FadD [Mycobacteroides abscessus subsp. abscessus]SIH68153.1 fatty-acid-CoA ligase FadD [Mycobacteroides abscessus subsp. abscessus]SKD20240.1 fatty-acid-CoA ligase FadD [Mycobacteroides abscessus subsp. abscessus]
MESAQQTPELTIPAALDQAAARFGERDALYADGSWLSFSELRARARRFAAALIALGVEHGQRLAIWSPNSWHWPIACLGGQYAGAAVVPMNTRYTVDEATDILQRSHARVLVSVGKFLGTDRIEQLDTSSLPDLRHIVRVAVEDGDESGWDAFVAHGDGVSDGDIDTRKAAVSSEDISDILFTSGTTGRSKGVLCMHRQPLAASLAWATYGEFTENDRYLCVNPFFHNFGYKAGILACLQTGAALMPQLTFDPEKAMAAVQEHKITVLPGAPTIFQMLLDHPARKNYDLTSLRYSVTGAAVVPVVLIERMQSELDFDLVLTAYGLTETQGFATICRSDDDAVTVATTCGRPMLGYELRIDGAEKPGDEGEVLLHSANVMKGYLDDPKATAEAIDDDGWLHTGDIGKLDARGNLTITDRLKDMYICGGFNVYPAEIEQVLMRLDGVADVAVIGVPDARLGEVGKAYIVLKPGATLNADSVIEYSAKHVANFKKPRFVDFLDELPRNLGGKVVKPTLRAMHGEQRRAQKESS